MNINLQLKIKMNTKKTLKRIKTFENDWDRIKNY